MSLRQALGAVSPTPPETRDPRPGDDLVPGAAVVMDRGFDLRAAPETVWPWLVQLGKDRAGWYLPWSVERLVPRARRAGREIDPCWQSLAVGDVVPDYGASSASFTVAMVDAPHALVYESHRGGVHLSWAITLTTTSRAGTRVHLRLRLGPLKRPWLATTLGDWFDLLTIAGMAAGLRERLGRPDS